MALQKQQTIGIIGGGQLGRMLTLAALPLGFKVTVVDPTPDCPAAQVGARQITAGWDDGNAIRQLAREADFVTIEVEHINAEVLEQIQKMGKPVNPSAATVRLIQDKLAQKSFLYQQHVPVADFVEITDEAAAQAALQKFGGQMLIKTRHGAYDGRGNIIVKNHTDIQKAFGLFAGKPLYAEAYVPFVKELAVLFARDIHGKIVTYPVVETIHKRNICDEVICPAPISDALSARAQRVAKLVAGLLSGAGVFAVEMFLTKDGRILVNEIAPRVHNSGHHTIEASRTSQFEQHIRAVSGLPLGSTELVVPASVMVNILGERKGPTELTGSEKLLALAGVSLHLYGKSPTKIDRKMGHVTATGQKLPEVRRRARRARRGLSI